MTPNDEPRFRRLEPDERRGQILASAVRHFAARPYADVGVAEIAAEAGVVRGLVNHYFGTKRELYLEVVRTMMFVPPTDDMEIGGDTLEQRVASAVDWLLGVIEAAGHSWVAIAGSGARGSDPEVQAILDEADDRAADRVLEVIGFTGTPRQRQKTHAAVRAFGGMVKAMGREVVDRRSLSPAEARRQLSAALLAVLESARGR